MSGIAARSLGIDMPSARGLDPSAIAPGKGAFRIAIAWMRDPAEFRIMDLVKESFFMHVLDIK